MNATFYWSIPICKVTTSREGYNYYLLLSASITREVLDHRGVSLSEQHTAAFIFCHDTQTMYVVIAL